jgi:hypothetical protein
VAICPCTRHQDAFVAALRSAEQLFLYVTEAAVPVHGDGDLHMVEAGDEIKVASATAPDGRTFLQAYTDLETGRARFPDAPFISVDAQVAFRMSVSNDNAGLLLSTSGEDHPWAAVTAEGINELLTPDRPDGAG